MGCQAQEIASQVTLRKVVGGGMCVRERGGVRLCRSLQQEAGSLNIRKLLIIGNQVCQMKKFCAFLCRGRCKSLGSLKPVLLHESQLSGASILFFFFFHISLCPFNPNPNPPTPPQFFNARCEQWLQLNGWPDSTQWSC